jgi:4-methylaminobutanoate oxidase (formaldehyde-forming)
MRNAQICETHQGHLDHGRGRRAATVHTDQGDITCEMVVNAAGMWGMEIGQMAGAHPRCRGRASVRADRADPRFHPAELRRMPTMRDPDLLVYYKPDGPGLLIGGTSPHLPFGLDGSDAFQRQLLDPDFDRFEQLAMLAAQRTPVIEQAGIRTMINGPIPYSADADFVMGQVPSSTTTTSPPGSSTDRRRWGAAR